MIARLWRGWTDASEAAAYEILLAETIIPGIEARKIKGLRSIRALRRDRLDLEEVEFMTIMTFDDWAAVETFAGPKTNTSVVPDAARSLLKRFDRKSTHYEDIADGDSPRTITNRFRAPATSGVTVCRTSRRERTNRATRFRVSSQPRWWRSWRSV